MKKFTTVYGVLSQNDGTPYKGAIVKFNLSQPFTYEGEFYGNSEREAVTNKFGIFELELAPSVLSEENFYYLRIIFDNVLDFKIKVPESDTPVNFSDLEKYFFDYERIAEIGECC